jgi:hypothetical protein
MREEDGVSCIGDTRNLSGILFRKPSGKGILVRPWHRGKNDIKMDIKELEFKNVV